MVAMMIQSWSRSVSSLPTAMHVSVMVGMIGMACPNGFVRLSAAAMVLCAGLWAIAAVLGFGSPKRALGGDGWVSLTLVAREDVTHDTRLLRFALPSADHVLGLPAGQHVSLRSVGNAAAGEKVVCRAYTPVTGDENVGFVDFVVKIYFPNVHPRFPAGGAMSARLERLQVGETLDFRGPKGKVTYLGKGAFRVGKGYAGPAKGMPRSTAERTVRAARVGMVCGGSGVTPMLQVAMWAARHEATSNAPSWTLVAANQTPADILCRNIIEQLEANWPAFRKWYTVDRLEGAAPGARGEAAEAGSDTDGAPWKYSVGFVTEQMLREQLPPAAPDTVILLCGPPPMLEYACLPALTALGHAPENILCF